MRHTVAKRIRKEMIGADAGEIRRAKRAHIAKRKVTNPKPKTSKRQARLAAKQG
jgi:hypothetical protein